MKVKFDMPVMFPVLCGLEELELMCSIVADVEYEPAEPENNIPYSITTVTLGDVTTENGTTISNIYTFFTNGGILLDEIHRIEMEAISQWETDNYIEPREED